MPVTLRSLSSTIQTLNLTNQYEPRRIAVQRVVTSPGGESAITEKRLMAPGVLTLLAGAGVHTLEAALKQGAAKAGLPESVLEAPEVKAALARRPKVLEVILEKPAAGSLGRNGEQPTREGSTEKRKAAGAKQKS